MAPKAKLKTPAQTYAPQTADDCAADIRRLGDMHRAYLRDEAAMNDEIAVITQRYQPILSQARTTMDEIQQGVQTFCEANRHRLTDDGKTKTGNFVTGSVQWRQRPPSVSVRGMESVIDTLRRLGLSKFLRVKEEVNKEAILNEPDLVRGVAGITVVTGVEDFLIAPFEAKTEGVA